MEKGRRVTTPAQRFGLLLARRRMLVALGQEDLARLVGIHRTEVSLLERGGRRPRLDTILQLVAAVEAEPGELLSGMRWAPGIAEKGGGYVTSTPRGEASHG
jgi:transcriptional regulator with XRE-family HTH domain